MNRKIVSIFVSMLLCVTVLSVTGTQIVEEDEVLSCESAPRSSKFQYNVGDLSCSGDICYAVDCTANNFVWFDTDTPNTYNTIAPTGFVDFPQGACFVEETWWVCDSNGLIYTVDETTGTMTYVGNAGTGGLNGLAYDPISGILYGGSVTNLYTIDQGTGVATLVGPFNGLGWMISIACDGFGNMYGIDLDLSDAPFYSISTSTGAATLIGHLGIPLNFGQDMAYDIDNDILYHCAVRYYGGSYYPELYTIDTTSGSATFVGSLYNGDQTTCAAIPYATNPPLILEIGNITGRLFKVSTAIRNIGGVDATMVNWSITLDGGVILLGKETSGGIPSIPVGDEKTISSGLILGFGKTVIIATAECNESSDAAERDAFVLLFFIL